VSGATGRLAEVLRKRGGVKVVGQQSPRVHIPYLRIHDSLASRDLLGLSVLGSVVSAQESGLDEFFGP
jgi:hypothetical protein